MTGPACQQKIERAVRSLAGVQAAVVCLERGYGDVEYDDDKVVVDRILTTIRAAGYGARVGG